VRDVSARHFAHGERPIEPHAEPSAELFVIGERPDAGNGRLELNGFLDPIGSLVNGISHGQPLGCLSPRPF
jgi:hypothetical protein